jgi:hypothetical protein
MWRHIPHALVEDCLRLGWKVEVPARWTRHDEHSVPMRWICPCRPVLPVALTSTLRTGD